MVALAMGRRCVSLLVLIICAASGFALPVRAAQVVFDLPSSVQCRDVTPPEFRAANPSLKVIEGRLRISARVTDGSEAEIEDYLYVIDNQSRTMRFQDYLPNTTLESAFADDQIAITDASEDAKTTGIDAHVVYRPFTLGGSHSNSRKKSESTQYKKIAPKELVLASGTTNREHGVFFRLRPSRAASLEGAKEFTFLATVPVTWRAGLCRISCIARTESSTIFSSSVKPAGNATAQVPLHMEGDVEAAQIVRAFRRAQQAYATALTARERDTVFDTISSHTVGLLTEKSCKTKRQRALAEAEAELADAQARLADLTE